MKKKRDLTLTAIQKQLKAMASPSYEVGLYNREKETMWPRFWNEKEIINSVSWLKKMNQEGNDIFIRPSGCQGLIFFDDLNINSINLMKKDGFHPAVIIESSPLNFQGWIRVTYKKINKDIATVMCKLIAKKYNGDVHSADWRHYGRLSGFTNQKPKHISFDGKQPFVLFSSGQGKIAKNARLLINKANDLLQKKQAEQNKQKIGLTLNTNNNSELASNFFNGELQGLINRYNENLDRSVADWMIINKMIKKGYTRESIEIATREHSLAYHKRGKHSELYLKITLDEAFLLVGKHEK